MKILKTFQPFVVLIALTIHQIFFITFTNSKMPFNISSLMYEGETKDNKKGESHLISNFTDVYTLAGFSSTYNESKRSRIPFMDFFTGFFISETQTKSEKLGRHVKAIKNASDVHKNRLHHSAVGQENVIPVVTVRKKRTKSNRLLKKLHRDFRHMHKKSMNVDGWRLTKRANEFFKNKSQLADSLSAGRERKIDFSKNRFKRTTVQGNVKAYFRENRDQFDLSREYGFEYKIKDGLVDYSETPNYTNGTTTEKTFSNLVSHLVSSDLDKRNNTGYRNLISHPISTAVPVYGSFVKRDAVNFSSPVNEAVKSAEKRIMKWPIKRVVSVEGDVIIGGLMMVHSRGEGDKLCGPIMPQGGVQALEVMLYTLKMINKNPHIPFRIGAHILDDCDTDTYGLEMALDFIKG